jgi:hypothetical protein
MAERRLGVWLIALTLAAVPAAVLRFACAGASCPPPAPPPAAIPFCGLAEDHRALVRAGYREGRSPDVLATTASGSIVSTGSDGSEVPWPSTDDGATAVPIAFIGRSVGPGGLPEGSALDTIAPTMAALLGFTRPFPEVRSGRALPGVVAGSAAPLGVVIVWSGVGTSDLERAPGAWPSLERILRRSAATLDGTTGSLPVDPVASTATIGVGATPSLHGVTGGLVRADDGSVVAPVGAGAPTPVLATLAEDLDEGARQDALIGVIGRARTDTVVIGGSWYVDEDRDDIDLQARDPVAAVHRLLTRGYGSGGPADLIGVVLHGSIRELDRWTAGVLASVRRAAPMAAFAIAGTGSLSTPAPRMGPPALERRIGDVIGADVVEAVGSSGVFLDAFASAASGVGADRVATLLRGTAPPPGEPRFADVYPGFSVTLGGYC